LRAEIQRASLEQPRLGANWHLAATAAAAAAAAGFLFLSPFF